MLTELIQPDYSMLDDALIDNIFENTNNAEDASLNLEEYDIEAILRVINRVDISHLYSS